MGTLSYYEEPYYEDFETNNLPKEKKEKKQEIPTPIISLHY